MTVAGGALYVAYDSGLLGGSAQGSEVLSKAKAAIPPAVDEWMKYFGLEVQSLVRHQGKRERITCFLPYVSNGYEFDMSLIHFSSQLFRRSLSPRLNPGTPVSPTTVRLEVFKLII